MRINLLPPEVYERQKVRRRTAGVVLVGLIVLGALGAFYFLQVVALNQVEDDIAAQQQENSALQAQINELQEIDLLVQELETTRALLSNLLSDRVLWSGILRDISLVIPGQTWLDGLTGDVGAVESATGAAEAATTPGAAAQPSRGGTLIGSITFNGHAFGHRDVALWLSRLEDVRGFVNPWLSNSAKTIIGDTEVVQFASSVDLSEKALANTRGGKGGGGK